MSDIIIPGNPGRIITRKAVTDNYTVTPADYYVVASVTAKTLTLPAASSVPAGQSFRFGVTANGTVSTTVARASGDTIGGAAGNLTVTSTTGAVEIVSDGVSNWESVRAGT